MDIRHLSVSFAGKSVFLDYSLTLPDAGITYLSGASGAGKTTLLRVLAGLLVPSVGTVTVSGRSVLLFQENRLFPCLRVRQQVEAVLSRDRQKEADRWLALCELTGSEELLPGELSGGMARRTALARCLAVPGDVYLLDEPFAGVDVDRAERILKKLSDLRKPIVITGHLPALARLCDQTIIL